MSVDTNIIIATNAFDGFQNYAAASFSALYAGGNITAGNYVGPVRAQTPLNNANAVSILLIQYVGIDAFTRLLPGALVVDYPNFAAVSYQIESFSYYSGGNLVVDNYIINQTGSTITLPAVTFTCSAKLYQPPF